MDNRYIKKIKKLNIKEADKTLGYNGACELVSENLSHLGGPMGSEYTTTNFRKFFKSVDEAKKYAEKDYKKNRANPIKWEVGYVQDDERITSGDLGFVMYEITKIEYTK